MKKQEFIKNLTKLVAFSTVEGNTKAFNESLEYVEKMVNRKVKIKKFKNKSAQIFIAGNGDLLSPTIGYLVHMDVVSAKTEDFKVKQKGDKLFGRGVSDMKFSIPMGVELLSNLIAEKSKLSFSLVITTDEEMGGFDGGKYLADELKFRPKFLLVPDGGDNLVFVDRAKGVCQLFITSKGSPAHASRPWLGKNALEPLVILSNELIKRYGKNGTKENWNTTMNIGIIQGGISPNQVCPEAVMKLDFRYPETDSIERIKKEVGDLAKSIDKNLKMEIGSSGMPTFTDAKLDVVKKFLKAMGKVYGKKIVVKPTFGASDARHFSKYNIPVLMMKPMGGNIHADNEWISVSSCMKFYGGLKIFLNELDCGKV